MLLLSGFSLPSPACDNPAKLCPLAGKKAIVRRFSRDWHAGYLPPAGFIAGDEVQLLDLAGKLVGVAVRDVKWICFVRDFQSGDARDPERLQRKSFASRPRTQGLWVRVRLLDSDILEGLVQNDVSLLDADGLFLMPPDARSNTQRIFIPRQAVLELEVLAVIRPAARREATENGQESLFRTQNAPG